VHADPALTRGGCVVDTELGTVDARLETRLDALARALGL
jgi:flagellar biosynthesis/type III secretory pathway protein FliH